MESQCNAMHCTDLHCTAVDYHNMMSQSAKLPVHFHGSRKREGRRWVGCNNYLCILVYNALKHDTIEQTIHNFSIMFQAGPSASLPPHLHGSRKREGKEEIGRALQSQLFVTIILCCWLYHSFCNGNVLLKSFISASFARKYAKNQNW